VARATKPAPPSIFLLNYLEGEVRLEEEVAALFYRSSASVTFILPAADGRRLQIIEAVISV